MKVIKIVVDELPELCTKCWFSGHADYEFEDRWWCEGIIKKNNDIENPYKSRPDWCPLKVDDE